MSPRPSALTVAPWLAAALLACGGEAPTPGPSPLSAATDAGADTAAPPFLVPDESFEELCAEYPLTGSGSTWSTAPATATTLRPLRCLGNGERLSGRFVSSTFEWPSRGGAFAVTEASRVYDYPLGDPRANQPALYHRVTEMALAHWRLFPAAAYYGRVAVYSGEFSAFYSRYEGRALVLGRRMIAGGTADMHIAAHEYGHHVVSTLAPGLRSATLHEGLADFFGCLPPEGGEDGAPLLPAVPAFLQRDCANDRRWPEAARSLGEVCAAQLAGFQSTGWDAAYPAEYADLAAGCAALPARLREAVEPHVTGMIVSGALWSLSRTLGRATTIRLVLHALSVWKIGGDLGSLGEGLLEADRSEFGGAHAGAIAEQLALRGMTADVGLWGKEQGFEFPCRMTPGHHARGVAPAGPLLSSSTAPRTIVRPKLP